MQAELFLRNTPALARTTRRLGDVEDHIANVPRVLVGGTDRENLTVPETVSENKHEGYPAPPCISIHPCYMLCCLLTLLGRKTALIPGPNT